MNLIEGLRKEFKVSGHFVSILGLAVWSLVLILNMFPLKFLGTVVLLSLQYRQRAIQRETGTGISFVSLNQIVLLSVPTWKLAICCDCLSVVVVIVTNLANLWIYSPLYLLEFSGKNLLKKS